MKTSRVLLKTFEISSRGRLGTTREDFKTTQGSAGVPSILEMIQAFLRTFGLWNSATLMDYSARPSRLLEDILLHYKVLGGLSYRYPWAHYQGGYWSDYYVGPWDYSTWATRRKMVWSARQLEGLYSVRKLGMSRSM
jgi:hypothetical protein